MFFRKGEKVAIEFDDIRETLKSISFDSTRIDCDNFFEGVIVANEVKKLTDRLERFLGEPVWPSKNRLSFAVQAAVESYGGLMPGQTLYYAGQDSNAVLAMVWPWRDGKHTTIKVIKKE